MEPITPQSIMPTTGLPPLHLPAQSTPHHQTGRFTSRLRYMPIFISPGTSSSGTGQREVQFPNWYAGPTCTSIIRCSGVAAVLQTPTWPQLLWDIASLTGSPTGRRALWREWVTLRHFLNYYRQLCPYSWFHKSVDKVNCLLLLCQVFLLSLTGQQQESSRMHGINQV